MSKELPPEVAEFDKELYNLFDSRAVSASKIDKLTKLAFKAAKYYKNIVYCLEKFITRCVPEYKLTGLYVLDSICRTSQSVKSKSSSSGSFSGAEYVARFEKNIEALFTEFTKVQEDKEKEKVKRVVVLWERSGTFAPSTTDTIRKKYFPLLETKGDKTTATDSDTSASTTTTATTKDQQNTQISSPSVETTTASVTNAASLISTLASLAQSSGSSTPTSSGSSSNGYSVPGWTSAPQPSSTTPSHPPGTSDPSSAEASAQALQTILATVFQVNSATAPGPPTASHLAPPAPFQSMYTPSFPSHLQPHGMLSSSIEAPNNNNSVPTNTSAFMYGVPGATSTTAVRGPAAGGDVPGYTAPGRRDPRTDPRLRVNGNEPNGEQVPPTFSGSTAPGSTPGFDTQALAQLSFLLKPQAQASPHPQGPPHGSMELPKSDELMGMNMHPARLSLLQGATMGHGPRATGGPGGPAPQGPQGPREMPRPLTSNNNNNNSNNSNNNSSAPSDRPSRQPYQRHPLPPNPLLAQLKNRPKGLIEVREDPQVGSDQIRVISRTLWVGGGFIPTISVPDLEAIFAPKGQIATCMINQAKFNAFIKMADRAQAERCKAELDRTTVQGEVMKVGWGCGFGPRDCFDYTSGASVIPLDRLTDTDRRWLSSSVVGGFGPNEVIRGGVVIFEPNIEAVEHDGREALPRKSRVLGGANATGMGRGGDMGRGRGRGRGMDVHGGSEFTPSFRGGGRGGHRGGHQGESQAGASPGSKREFEHEGGAVASAPPPTTGQEERRDVKKSRWG